jgi:tyrosine-protein kinase Etk/Wzc
MSEDSASRASPDARDEGEIGLLDLVIILAKHKKLVLGFPFGFAVAVALITLTFDNVYTGTAKILPPQQNQSSALAMLNQVTGHLGGLGGLAGTALGIRNPNDMYIGMLKSRVVADSMIKRFDLQKLYEKKYLVDTRRALQSASVFQSGKDGIISIEVDDRDPQRAAQLANAYVDELHKLTQTIAVTEASQRRLFFERQLEGARKSLAVAEDAARRGLDKGGIVIIDSQGRAMVETTARLRAQISVKEIQISAMRAFATERNPELQQAQYEMEAMKKELAKIEGTASGVAAKSADVPGGMESFNLLRELKYRETIADMLTKQYEIAKLDEARDTSIIQVLEPAVQPERKSKPKRAIITIVCGFLAGIFAILWAFAREAKERAMMDPVQAERWLTLRRHLRWR